MFEGGSRLLCVCGLSEVSGAVKMLASIAICCVCTSKLLGRPVIIHALILKPAGVDKGRRENMLEKQLRYIYIYIYIYTHKHTKLFTHIYTLTQIIIIIHTHLHTRHSHASNTHTHTHTHTHTWKAPLLLSGK